ncbi:MAG TPA: hypothetical protein VM737_11775 [Gemmatimonadota bacterium]|nr:hypothetical protein [Gemmatimonadota bacterium]
MIGTRWTLSIVTLLVLGSTATAAAQQAPDPIGSEPVQLAQVDPDEANRQVLRAFMEREPVQRVAGLAGVDMDKAMAGVLALEGERLASAAAQARAIDREIGAQDRISLSATTIIIVLLLLIVIIIAA